MIKKFHSITDKITFGKYRGKTIQEITKDDPDYLAWACDNIEWFELDQEAIDALDFAVMDNEEPTGGGFLFSFNDEGRYNEN